MSSLAKLSRQFPLFRQTHKLSQLHQLPCLVQQLHVCRHLQKGGLDRSLYQNTRASICRVSHHTRYVEYCTDSEPASSNYNYERAQLLAKDREEWDNERSMFSKEDRFGSGTEYLTRAGRNRNVKEGRKNHFRQETVKYTKQMHSEKLGFKPEKGDSWSNLNSDKKEENEEKHHWKSSRRKPKRFDDNLLFKKTKNEQDDSPSDSHFDQKFQRHRSQIWNEFQENRPRRHDDVEDADYMYDEELSEEMKSSRQRTNNNWADTFGTMQSEKRTIPKWDANLDKADEEEEKPHVRLAATGRRNTQYWYFLQVVKLGKQGKVREAVAVLDDWMLVRDRVMPTTDIFTAVIGILGRTAHTEMAFQYYKKMRQYGLKPVDPTYTALFNACSNCHQRAEGLGRATWLRKQMKERSVMPNIITYNAMIKAFGVCGDLRTAFLVADEAMSNRVAVNGQFFCSLLMTTISNKEEGLLYAIEVWRRMKMMRISVDNFHYKLLLQAITECGLGDPAQQAILLQPVVSHKKIKAQQRKQREEALLLTQTSFTLEAGNVDTTVASSTIPVSEEPEKTDLENEEKSMRLSEDLHKIISVSEEIDKTISLSKEVDKTVSDSEHLDETISLSEDLSNTILLVEDSNKRVSLPEDLGKVTMPQAMDPLQCSPELAMETANFSSDLMENSSENTAKLNLPDLLNPSESFSEVVSLGDVTTVQDRMLLMGGVSGFLQKMEGDGLCPDIVVLSMLIGVARGRGDEDLILAEVKNRKIQVDTEFLNALVRKRVTSGRMQEAKDVIPLFSEFGLVPIMNTFRVLALGHRTPQEGKDILQSIDNAGMMPDVKILSSLIRSVKGSYDYRKYLLKKMESLDIAPDRVFLKIVEELLQKERTDLLKKRRSMSGSHMYPEETRFNDFNNFYKHWLMKNSVTELDDHFHPLSKPEVH